MTDLKADVLQLVLKNLSWKECGQAAIVSKLWNQVSKTCKEELCISEDIAFWPELKQVQIEHLNRYAQHVRSFEVLTEEMRERSHFKRSKVSIRGNASFFPPGTIPEDEIPKKSDDYEKRSAAEKKISEKVKVSVHNFFASFPKIFPRLDSVDLRGLESYGDDSELSMVLKAILPIAHQITSLRLERSWKSSVYPEQLSKFPNLTRLTYGYPGLVYSPDGDEKDIPKQILSLAKLKTLELYIPLASCSWMNLKKLSNLQELNITLGKDAKFKDIKLPKSIKYVHVLCTAKDAITDLSNLRKAQLEKFVANGSFRLEWRSINDNPEKFPNVFPSTPKSWKDSLVNVSQLNFSNMGMQSCAFDESWTTALGAKGKLRTFIAPYNYFSDAPFLANFATLTELDLSHNQLASLPDSIGDMKSLKKLKLNVNLLTQLPTGLAGLSALELIDVSENRFTLFPTVLLSLHTLQELCLDENDVGSPPEEVFLALPNLEELSMIGCCVEELSESVAKLSKLRTLLLSYNLIDDLPQSIAAMKSLERLSLRFNPLDRIPLVLPLCSSNAVGPLLTSLKKYLSGEIQIPPADIEALHKSHFSSVVLPPVIKLSSEYSAPPDQREGAWFFFAPERRSVIGHGSFENDPDDAHENSKQSVWFTMVSEWVYRQEWTSYSEDFRRWRQHSYEFSSAWTSPTEKRDRISMCQFAGNGSFAGLALASAQKTTSKETQDKETAYQDKLNKTREHEEKYRKQRLEEREKRAAQNAGKVLTDQEKTWAENQKRSEAEYDKFEQLKSERRAGKEGRALEAKKRKIEKEDDKRYIIQAEYRLSGRAARDEGWNARGHWATTVVKLLLNGATLPLAVETSEGERYREPK